MEDKDTIIPAIWVGIEDDQRMVPGYLEPVVAIIIRKATIHQFGQFLRHRVSINNLKVWTSSTEYRTHGFQNVKISNINSILPNDAIWALGWDASKKHYAFNFKGWPCSIQDSAMYGVEESLRPLSINNWTEEWKFRMRQDPFWSPFKEYIQVNQQPIRLPKKKSINCLFPLSQNKKID